MLINENGLVRAIRNAYKHSGYTVSNQGESMAIYTEMWFVKCKRAVLPRKVLATIVEHMGMIPDENTPASIVKDDEPQQVIQEVVRDDMEHWCMGQRGDGVTMVPVILQGYQIFQTPGGGSCYGVPLTHLDMLERETAEHGEADVVDSDRLLWQSDGEVVVLAIVRKARSGLAKEWERVVWNALESVDLHKEEQL